MKSREQKLLELIQPKGYVSKIKLYCHDCKFSVQKFGNAIDNSYIYKQIKIIEL